MGQGLPAQGGERLWRLLCGAGPMTKRPYSRRRGNAMVEFAVAVPMIVLIFAGTFQFGYYFYIYNRLEGAARAGARYASLRDYNSSTSTPASDFVTAVNNMVVYGSP